MTPGGISPRALLAVAKRKARARNIAMKSRSARRARTGKRWPTEVLQACSTLTADAVPSKRRFKATRKRRPQNNLERLPRHLRCRADAALKQQITTRDCLRRRHSTSTESTNYSSRLPAKTARESDQRTIKHWLETARRRRASHHAGQEKRTLHLAAHAALSASPIC